MNTRSLAPLILSMTCAASASFGAPNDALAQAKVSLEEVITSAREQHPALEAARLEVEAARAKERDAQGAFDLQLESNAQVYPLGKKPYSVLDFRLNQPLPYWGIHVFGGWHNSLGTIPDYKDQWYQAPNKKYLGVYKTTPDPGAAGKLHAGAAVPLLRDRATDKRRNKLEQVRAKIDEAQAKAQKKRLAIELKAAESYFYWLASARMVEVAEQLIDRAETNQAQIEERIARGELAEIYASENRLYLLKRQSKLVDVERKLSTSANKLSLFLRAGETGDPVSPVPASAPESWPKLNVPTLDETVALAEQAATSLPEWVALDAKRRAIELEVALATNTALPRLDLTMTVGQKLEKDSYLDGFVGFGFSSPLQRRQARGQADSAEAKMRSVEAKMQLVRETTVANARGAWFELDAAKKQVEIAAEQLMLAKRLEDAEREKFMMGGSTLFVVNARELTTAKTSMDLIEAQRALHTAHARYNVTLGLSPDAAE